MPPSPHKLLSIYLNDHLATATAAVELARRIVKQNAGTPLGAFAEEVAGELSEERRTLEHVMETSGVRADPVKQGLAWAGEKAGRLKLNGALREYSPLSKLVELEALGLALEGQRLLWSALAATGAGAGIETGRAEELASRAERRRGDVERLRVDVAHETLGAGAPA